MPSPTQFQIVFAEPPPNFSGTWADFVGHLNENGEVRPDVDFASFVVGSVEPSSDQGPWLKDGKKWYWFDPAYGNYVPIDARVPTPYTVSKTAPAAPVADPDGILPTPPSLWLEIDAFGNFVDIHLWNGTIWTSSQLPVVAPGEPALAFRKRVWVKTDASGYPTGQYKWDPAGEKWINFDTFWIQPEVPEPTPEPTPPPAPGDPEPDPEPEPVPVPVEDEKKKPWIRVDSDGYPIGLYIYDSDLRRWREPAARYPFSYRRIDNFPIASGSGENTIVWQRAAFDPYEVAPTGAFRAPVTGFYQFNYAVQWEYDSGSFTGKTMIVSLVHNGAPVSSCMNEDPDNAGQFLANGSALLFCNKEDRVTVTAEIGPTATGECIWRIATAASHFQGFLVEEVVI
jgi:hypothetical protein